MTGDDAGSAPDKRAVEGLFRLFCEEPGNHRQIARLLAGTGSYDALAEQEQAIVREEWADRMTALRGALDYAARFEAAGESYSEVDEDGNLVVHPSRG